MLDLAMVQLRYRAPILSAIAIVDIILIVQQTPVQWLAYCTRANVLFTLVWWHPFVLCLTLLA